VVQHLPGFNPQNQRKKGKKGEFEVEEWLFQRRILLCFNQKLKSSL
jgi:hypothetical protein